MRGSPEEEMVQPETSDSVLRHHSPDAKVKSFFYLFFLG